ncbi:uncharacterized protein LOC131154239 [Malania oleifera]|uniref:uncharacterized protein LOC131154239 n=1 Tax=Malania oleifera TaxID=397392 RepID=UPI0025AE8AA1|nr:uncharacterized protein LOC131154239 [Malania oleifera]
MGFSYGDDLGKKESEVAVIYETGNSREERGMDVRHGVESNAEFWPIEHPMEPPDEDRPVKCPMPGSSALNNGGMHEKQFAESLGRRAELSAVVNEEGMVVVAAEPPVRVVRKRHHTLTGRDHTIVPLIRMPLLPPLPVHNITIFEMLQQLDKFES